MRISTPTLATAAAAVAAITVLPPASATAKMHAREAKLFKNSAGQCDHDVETNGYRLRKGRRDRSVWEVTNIDGCADQVAILCVYSTGGTPLPDRFETCTTTHAGADLNTTFSVPANETVGLMCKIKRTGPSEKLKVRLKSGAAGTTLNCPQTILPQVHVINIEIVP